MPLRTVRNGREEEMTADCSRIPVLSLRIDASSLSPFFAAVTAVAACIN